MKSESRTEKERERKKEKNEETDAVNDNAERCMSMNEQAQVITERVYECTRFSSCALSSLRCMLVCAVVLPLDLCV